MSTADAISAWDKALDIFVVRDLDEIRRRIPKELAIDWSAVGADISITERSLLRRLCISSLVLELNCARLLNQLDGDTPEERFDSFVSRFAEEKGWASLFEEYRVLGALVDETRMMYREQAVEMLSRLHADSLLLGAQGLPQPTTERPLTEVSVTLSDAHRGGRQVWRMTFGDRDAGMRLMYKPKPLAADARFQRALAWCNDAIDAGKLAIPRLRELLIVDRGAYGWAEYVRYVACDDEASVSRFYERQGALLALLHVLLGTDIHRENLVAHGEYPVIVDLETLFHPHLVKHGATSPVRLRVDTLLHHSVLRTGMLPWRAFVRPGNAGVNLGALADDGSTDCPMRTMRWASLWRDDAHLEEADVALPRAENVPGIGDTMSPFYNYTDAIVTGFARVAGHVSQHRESWIRPGGLLDVFADVTVRYVLRPTEMYSNVLKSLRHPDNLRDHQSVEESLRALKLAPALIPSLPDALLDAEHDDLLRHDVPVFSGVPSSRGVWDSRDEQTPNVLTQSMLEVARTQLTEFDDAAVARESWLVRASLAAGGADALRLSASRSRVAVSDRSVTAVQLLEAAVTLGERICERAISAADGVTWIGHAMLTDGAFSVGPVGDDLYDGVPGIAIFLAQLGRATGEGRFADMARRAVTPLIDALCRRESAPAIGGFVGYTGQLYALAHVAAALQAPELVRSSIDAIAGAIRAAIEATTEADILYGSAGSALALCAVYESTRCGVIVPLLAECVTALERTAIETSGALAWKSGEEKSPLLGFAHGAIGIAYALARLKKLFTGIDPAVAARCEHMEAGALSFERRNFDAKRNVWPDFRECAGEGRDVAAWCHGAPGEALGRLVAPLEISSRAEAELAVNITLNHTSTISATVHSLCHGALGNLVIADRAARMLNRTDLQEAVAIRVAATLAEVRRNPLVDSAFPDAAFGIMLGTSGIGHALLVLADPSTPNPAVAKLTLSARQN